MNYIIKRVDQLNPGDFLPLYGIVLIIEQSAFVSENYFLRCHKHRGSLPYRRNTRMLVGVPNIPIMEEVESGLLLESDYHMIGNEKQ